MAEPAAETEVVPADTGADDDTKGLDDDDGDVVLNFLSKDNQQFSVPKKAAMLSELVVSILAGDSNAQDIELRQVPSETLELVVEYLKHHNGVQPPELQCPVRSTDMRQIAEEWDANFIDRDKKTIFEIILAANYMDIKSLLHLGCAKIATMIKALDQSEINRIIEEEERYRRENQQATGDEQKADE